MKKFILGLLFSATALGQTFHQLKVGNSSPINPSAILEVQGTTGALLCPRMTTTQKNAISSPVNGDIVYDSTLNQFAGYQGGSWSTIGAPGGLNLQFQYNNAGVFAGDTAVTNGAGGWSATSLALGSLTASTAIASDSTKHLVSSATTATELGYVSGVTSAIQTQFSGKQATGNYITALTGDGSAAGPGSAALTLATVNSNTGSFGSSTSIPTITVNAKGLITAVSVNAASAAAGSLSGTTLNATVVNSSLTSVGTISTGVWQGTAISQAFISNFSISAVKTSAYSVLSTDYTVLGDASTGSFAFSLPTASGAAGRVYVLKRVDQTLANSITITPLLTQTIDGFSAQHLATQDESLMIMSDGSNWQIINRRIPGTVSSYTPTVTGWGSPSMATINWYRQGQYLIGQGGVVTGTVSGTGVTITLPSGLAVSSSIITAASGRALIGSLARVATGALAGSLNAAPSATVIGASGYGLGATDPTGIAAGTNFGSSEGQSFFFAVPISGWDG